LTPDYEFLFKKNEKSNPVYIGLNRFTFAMIPRPPKLSLIRQKFLPWYFPFMSYAVSAIQQRPAMRWCDKMIATLDGDPWSTAGKPET
jgi:hypothetical protein